jgi:hypothetical protein
MSPAVNPGTYAADRAAFAKYRTIIIDPTTVYDGPDAQF